jgi:hypothetical protein
LWVSNCRTTRNCLAKAHAIRSWYDSTINCCRITVSGTVYQW